MPDISSLLPLVYAAFGWFLSEGSQYFRLRREKRLPIGIAITDLLNIRHRFRTIKLVTDEINKIEKLSPQQQLYFQHWFESLLPGLTHLHQRYEESMKAIAGIRPVLAFRLSDLDKLQPMLAQLRGLVLTDEKASTQFHTASSQLTELSSLDEPIRELAWKHGFRTWYEVRSKLRKPLSLPPEMQKVLYSLKSESTNSPVSNLTSDERASGLLQK